MTCHWNSQELLAPLIDALGNAAIVVSATGQVIAISAGARRRVARADARPIIDIASVFEDEPALRGLLAEAAVTDRQITASVRAVAAGGEAVRIMASRLAPAHPPERPALLVLTMQGAGRAELAGIRPGPEAGAATADLAPPMLNAAPASLEETAPRLKALSLKDPLTGLQDRRSFSERLHREWRLAAGRSDQLTLIVADIDRFDAYNSAQGRDDGDRVLRQVAMAIANAASRERDGAFRIGGEEFALLLPGTPLAGGERVAERIMANLAGLALPHPDNTPARITVSIGVASARPPGGEVWRDLLRRADGALYLAKREGRNRVYADRSAASGDGLPSGAAG